MDHLLSKEKEEESEEFLFSFERSRDLSKVESFFENRITEERQKGVFLES